MMMAIDGNPKKYWFFLPICKTLSSSLTASCSYLMSNSLLYLQLCYNIKLDLWRDLEPVRKQSLGCMTWKNATVSAS